MKKYILDPTGAEVDGIDEQFDALCRAIDYGKPSVLGRIQLIPGMPLYHICVLLEASKKNYGTRNAELQTSIARYVLAWVSRQSEKLTQILDRIEAADNPSAMKLSTFNLQFDNSQLSEFHLLLKHASSRDLQYIFTSYVIIGFGGLLTTNFEFLQSEAGILFSVFKRLLRKLSFVDPLLSNIKNKPTYLRDLQYINYCVLHFEMMKSIENRDFLRAEIFSNKASQRFNELGQNREFKNQGLIILRYLLTKCKVSLAEKSNDMVMMSYAIQDLISITEEAARDQEIARSGIIDSIHVSQSFNLAEVCFKMAENFEMAHRCAQESLKWSDLNQLENMEYSKQYHDALARLMSLYAQDPKFEKILTKVSSYSKSSVFLLQFSGEDHATYFRELLDRNRQAHTRVANSLTPEQKSTVAFTFNHEFNIDVYKLALTRVLDKDLHDEKQAKKDLERAIKLEQMKKNQQDIQKQDTASSTDEVKYYVHKPSAIYKPQKSKKGKKDQSMVISVPRCQFFEEVRRQPLKVVEFVKSKKIFDPNPENRTGVVTLCVDHVPGRWYAIFNPRLIDVLDCKVKLRKIMLRFFDEIVLSNDLCVPCKKEMAQKGLPYVFKIRLLGANGKGDIRIYAHVIETLTDGKSLIAFSSYDDKPHSKHSTPILLDFPDEAYDALLYPEDKLNELQVKRS